MCLELPRSYLLNSSSSASPPINWRHLESEAELACSQVATAERLLHQTLHSVHHNIVHPVQVSLGRKNEKILPVSPTASSMLTCSHSSYLWAVQILPPCRLRLPGHKRQSPLQRLLMLRPCLPLRLLLGKMLWHGTLQSFISTVLRTGLL
jgi:hypothetical protein